MYIYKYDSYTKEYIETMNAIEDKVATKKAGKPIYFTPAYTTFEKPPKVNKGEVAIFKNGKWVVEEDHRGETIYNLATREGKNWTEIGKLPKGYVTRLPERLEELKDFYLKTMKTNFDVCLTNTKVQIPSTDLYFAYTSLERLQNERATGIQMSRDDNNKIYSLTRQEYDVIINYMVTYGQYMYLQKWTIENILKKCADVELLKTHKDQLNFKVNPKQINNLAKLSPEKRKEYFMSMANNIK